MNNLSYSLSIIDHEVKVISCKNVLGKIPDYHINYSDHEGVYSEFEIRPNFHKGSLIKTHYFQYKLCFFRHFVLFYFR